MLAKDDSPILEAALAVLDHHPSMQLATTGGPYSPWVLGVYFAIDERAAEASAPLSLAFFLEESGKSLQNVRVDPRVAFMATSLDAKEDFVQGRGELVRLDGAEEERVRALLVAKMPWFVTYTPVVPVRLVVDELFVSSFERGWFPAKKIAWTASHAA